MLSSYLTAQAEFGIWRSLRSQCIKLSCSNCCLLQSSLSCHSSDRMSKLFFPVTFSSQHLQGSDMLFLLLLWGDSKCMRWRLQALVNPFAEAQVSAPLFPSPDRESVVYFMAVWYFLTYFHHSSFEQWITTSKSCVIAFRKVLTV